LWPMTQFMEYSPLRHWHLRMWVHSMMLEFSGYTGAPLSSCSDYMTHWGVHQVAVDARRNVELLCKSSFVREALTYLRARYRTPIVLRFIPVHLSIIVFFLFAFFVLSHSLRLFSLLCLFLIFRFLYL
jgi:hypothetical protein